MLHPVQWRQKSPRLATVVSVGAMALPRARGLDSKLAVWSSRFVAVASSFASDRLNVSKYLDVVAVGQMLEMQKSLQLTLSEHMNAKVLRQLHAQGDINGLLDWALMLNNAYMTQRACGEWSAKEAARSIGEGFLSRLDFQATAEAMAPEMPAE